MEEGDPEFKDNLSYIARGRKERMEKSGKGEKEGGGKREGRSYVARAPPNLGKGADLF